MSKPAIKATTNGPFLVTNLSTVIDAKARPITSKPVLALCRCGGSLNKPYCDGTHGKIGYSSKKQRTERWEVKESKGKEITVVDDVNACCHAGFCTELKDVFWTFDEEKNRYAHADKADKADIINTVKKCPSGSLMYKQGENKVEFSKRKEQILVTKDGPLWVMGGIEFSDDEHDEKRPSIERYTLCRCGASKNKPFCDGAHTKMRFKD